MDTKLLKLSSCIFALGLSTSGCSWVRGMFSSNDNGQSTQVAQATTTRSDAPPSEPMRVAADGHHVQDSGGAVVTSGFGDCVNAGFSIDSGKHPGECEKAAPAAMRSASEEPMPAKPKEEMPKPAAETAPLNPAGNGAPGIVQEKEAAKPMPAPPPAPVAEDDRPPAPEYEKVSLQSDVLFQFAKSSEASMLPVGKKKLQEMAARIANYEKGTVESITVIGHADRLGKTAANQTLSEQRALAVKKLLVDNGMNAKLIQTEGMGSSQPVKECKGTKKTPKLVACLEPNRRVEIIIRGIKEK